MMLSRNRCNLGCHRPLGTPEGPQLHTAWACRRPWSDDQGLREGWCAARDSNPEPSEIDWVRTGLAHLAVIVLVSGAVRHVLLWSFLRGAVAIGCNVGCNLGTPSRVLTVASAPHGFPLGGISSGRRVSRDRTCRGWQAPCPGRPAIACAGARTPTPVAARACRPVVGAIARRGRPEGMPLVRTSDHLRGEARGSGAEPLSLYGGARVYGVVMKGRQDGLWPRGSIAWELGRADVMTLFW